MDRKRHIIDDATIKRLAERKKGHTLEQLAIALGYPKSYSATISGVLRGEAGRLTPETENVLRARLGLAPVNLIQVTSCPDCGAVHTGRCHGEPGAVVWLRDGERVARARVPRRYRDLYAMPVNVLRWQLENRSVVQ